MKKILVVEDEELLIFAYQKSFEKYEDVKFKILETGDNFLEEVENFKPDVILLDLLLPGSDGIKLLRSLRAENKFNNIKAYILSNIDDKKVIKDAKSSGASGFFTKTHTTPEKILKKVLK